MAFLSRFAVVSAALFAVLLAALLNYPGVEAAPRGNSLLPLSQKHHGNTCPSSAVACALNGITGQPFPTCCVPDQGLLVYSQNWTAGYCKKSNNSCADSTLKNLPPNEFTVHGLWPDYCNGSYSTSDLGCDPSRRYSDAYSRVQQSAPSDLFQSMLRYWQSANGDYNWFWSHEWTKHATCLSTVDPICYSDFQENQDVVDFFTHAFNLRYRYDLYSAFEDAGLVPGSDTNYTRQQFQDALTSAFGHEGAIQCAHGDDGRFYLSEVWVYLQALPRMKFRTIDPVSPFNSCPLTGIVYPLQPYGDSGSESGSDGSSSWWPF